MAAPGSKAPARLAKVRWECYRSARRAKQAITACVFWSALASCCDPQSRKFQKRLALKWLLEFIREVNYKREVAFCGDSGIGLVAHTYTLNTVILGFKALLLTVLVVEWMRVLLLHWKLQELKTLNETPLEWAEISIVGDNIMLWRAIIEGPVRLTTLAYFFDLFSWFLRQQFSRIMCWEREKLQVAIFTGKASFTDLVSIWGRYHVVAKWCSGSCGVCWNTK